MLLGFKKQFAPKILEGSKKFTIRSPRKVEPKIGETLHMYTGLRTKYCVKISSEHCLTGIQLVDIYIHIMKKKSFLSIKVDGQFLNNDQIQSFVKADGFADPLEFLWYWLGEKGSQKIIPQVVSATDLIMYHWTDLRF